MIKPKPILSMKHVKKSFGKGHTKVNILKDVSLEILPGEIVSVVGPSGCGKSTLLQIAGLLDCPDSGTITIGGHNCSETRERRRTQLRRKKLGFVYQYHHLLPEFSALENIILPQLIAKESTKEAKITALKLLKQFGLTQRADHRPAELSGGEQQRVAIARALANQPALLLADEPTGNLDPNTSDDVYEVLLDQAKTRQLAIFIVTHNMELAKKANRTLTFKDGKIIKAKPSSSKF